MSILSFLTGNRKEIASRTKTQHVIRSGNFEVSEAEMIAAGANALELNASSQVLRDMAVYKEFCDTFNIDEESAVIGAHQLHYKATGQPSKLLRRLHAQEQAKQQIFEEANKSVGEKIKRVIRRKVQRVFTEPKIAVDNFKLSFSDLAGTKDPLDQ